MTQPDTREPRWTPGPWRAAAKPSSVVGWPIVSQQGRAICTVNYVQHSTIDQPVPGDRAFNAESRANAHLLAAAPELYEALDTLCAVLIHDHNHDLAYWQDALAVLAKARGEQP